MADARFAVLVPWRPRLPRAARPLWAVVALGWPPRRLGAEIEVRSPAGPRARGLVIGCPASDGARGWQVRSALRRALRHGAEVVGLGLPAGALPPAAAQVTDGRGLALAVLLEALAVRTREAFGPAARFVIWAGDAELARACARMLARSARHLTLVGRPGRLDDLAAEVLRTTGLAVELAADADAALAVAQAVVLAGVRVPQALARLPGTCLVADAAGVGPGAPARHRDVRSVEPPPVVLPGAGVRWPAHLAEAALLALAGPASRARLRGAALAERVEAVAELAARHGLRAVPTWDGPGAAGGAKTRDARRSSPDGGSEWA